MRRHTVLLQLESLESRKLLSGIYPALTPPAHVGVLHRQLPSMKHLPNLVSISDQQDPRFKGPAEGAPRYRQFAPTEVGPDSPLLNQPLGMEKAEQLAAALGLNGNLSFTHKQYLEFISGGGNGGDVTAAQVFDDSVKILTNSSANPKTVLLDGKPTQIALGSYGLTVLSGKHHLNMLASAANSDSPSRIVNRYLGPTKYLVQWCRSNGAEASLAMLRRSAYSHQIVYGNKAQQAANAAELALYRNGRNSGVVGLSMTPALWEINFCLIYTLNPQLAYNMPAHWTPIPSNVVAALQLSSNRKFEAGQVPFEHFVKFLNYHPESLT
jgi:hypothetical protein